MAAWDGVTDSPTRNGSAAGLGELLRLCDRVVREHLPARNGAEVVTALLVQGLAVGRLDLRDEPAPELTHERAELLASPLRELDAALDLAQEALADAVVDGGTDQRHRHPVGGGDVEGIRGAMSVDLLDSDLAEGPHLDTVESGP